MEVLSKTRLIILVIAGLGVVAASVVLSALEWSSPTHTAVSPENGPLAARLALLAGFGWLLVGLGLGSRAVTGPRSSVIAAMLVSGLLLGGVMGFLAWAVISFMFSS